MADPIKQFINTTWHNINQRTVNGARPNMKIPGCRRYIERGIKLCFTREEFVSWVNAHSDEILELRNSGQRPSIDRSDSQGHYEISNLRIRALADNLKAGRDVQAQRARAKRPIRQCIVCNKDLPMRCGEAIAKYNKKKTCDVTCMLKAIRQGKIVRGKAALTKIK